MPMKLVRHSRTRPDCMLEIFQKAQPTEEMFMESQRMVIKRLNKAVMYAFANSFPAAIPNLDRNSLRIIGFSDASFAKNDDFFVTVGTCLLRKRLAKEWRSHFN